MISSPPLALAVSILPVRIYPFSPDYCFSFGLVAKPIISVPPVHIPSSRLDVFALLVSGIESHITVPRYGPSYSHLTESHKPFVWRDARK